MGKVVILVSLRSFGCFLGRVLAVPKRLSCCCRRRFSRWSRVVSSCWRVSELPLLLLGLSWDAPLGGLLLGGIVGGTREELELLRV